MRLSAPIWKKLFFFQRCGRKLRAHNGWGQPRKLSGQVGAWNRYGKWSAGVLEYWESRIERTATSPRPSPPEAESQAELGTTIGEWEWSGGVMSWCEERRKKGIGKCRQPRTTRTTRNWLPKPATRWVPEWSCSLARNVVAKHPNHRW